MTTNNCSACGEVLDTSANFCGKCGISIKESETEGRPINVNSLLVYYGILLILVGYIDKFSLSDSYYSNSFFINILLCLSNSGLLAITLFGLFTNKKWIYKVLVVNSWILPLLIYAPIFFYSAPSSRAHEYWYIALPILYLLMIPNLVYLSKTTKK